MADDTRLAEACLLLNYSSHCHKSAPNREPQLQWTVTNNNQQACHSRGPENPRLIKQENITEQNHPRTLPTDLEMLQMHDTKKDPHLRSLGITISYPKEHAFDSSSQVEESAPLHHCPEIEHQTSEIGGCEPLMNLLAAVNCALPEVIVQRNCQPSATPIPVRVNSTLNSSVNHDHSYCRESTYSQSDISTPNSSDSSLGVSTNSLDRTYMRGRDSQDQPRKIKLVAVHLGAGNARDETRSASLARSICEDVMTLSRQPRKQSGRRSTSVKSICAICCRMGCSSHPLGGEQMDVETAVSQLVRRMEDHKALNCGYGSNLNISGRVECDASLMSDRSQTWAGVGAVSGCKNPILLAKALLDNQVKPRPLGLIQPNLLVGSGARQWMREHCPELHVSEGKLVSSKAFSTYQRLKIRYDAASRIMNYQSLLAGPESTIIKNSDKNPQPGNIVVDLEHASDGGACPLREYSPQSVASSSASLDHGSYCVWSDGSNAGEMSSSLPSGYEPIETLLASHEGHKARAFVVESTPSDYILRGGMERLNSDFADSEIKLDTVGAVAVDSENNFACAISSGGLLLKYKGRVGQAAVPGAGCWSEDQIAVTTTGVGEYLTVSLLAKKLSDKIQTLRLLYDLGHVVKTDDMSSVISNSIDECFEDLEKPNILQHVPVSERLVGLLSVCSLNSKSSPKRIDGDDLYLSYAHNTYSMCVGYMTCYDDVAKSITSRKEGTVKTNEPVINTIKLSY